MTDKKEVKFVICWSFFVLVLAFLPVFYGNFIAQEEEVFVSSTSTLYTYDVNSYFAWIRQAQEGSFLFEDKFTSEPHNAWIFQPIFLAIGHLSRFLAVDVMLIWYSAMLVSNIILLFTIYIFVANFFPGGNGERTSSFWQELLSPRALSFVLITASSGLGWAFDFWLPELSIFQSMQWPFIFSIAISLILLIFLAVLKAERTGQIKFIACAGLLTAILSVVHPYDLFLVISAVIAYLIINGWDKKQFKKSFLKIGVFLLVLSPGVAYNLFIIMLNPVFGAYSKIVLRFPNPIIYFAGIGITFVLGILGIYFGAKKQIKPFRLLLIWIIAAFILAYSPVGFSFKAMLGITIPFGIFAALAILTLIEKIRFQDRLRFIVLLILILSISNVAVLGLDAKNLKNRGFPYFVDKNFMAAMNWLGRNTENQDIILSSYETGNMIPRFTGDRVYIGHWPQTIDFNRKLRETEKFYSLNLSSQEMKKFMEDNDIDYVFCGPFEYECQNRAWEEKLLAAQAIPVFDGGGIKIYKTKD